MQCPKCGFVLSELDTECLRCKRMGERGVAAPVAPVQAAAPAAVLAAPAVEEKECPRCGKATGAMASTCDKCGYEYQAEASRSERYQALLAQEAAVPAPSALRRPLPQSLSWGIITACILVIGGSGWAMFGGSLVGSSADDQNGLPIIVAHHHKSHHAPAIQAVTYSVSGTATQAYVTYLDADAAPISPAAAVALPWTETFKAKTGTRLSVSALPSGAGGTLSVSIQVGSAVRKQADSPAANGQTMVEDTL